MHSPKYYYIPGWPAFLFPDALFDMLLSVLGPGIPVFCPACFDKASLQKSKINWRSLNMTDLRWPTNLCWEDQLRLSTLTLGNLYIFHRVWYTPVACNKTVRDSEASRASKAGEVSQSVRVKRAGARGPVQANHTVKLLILSWLRYFTLVGHLNKIWLVILSLSCDMHSIKM